MPGWNRKENSVAAPMPERPARRSPAANLRAWATVIKVTLCVPMALATGFGFLFHSPAPGPGLGGAIAGVLLLACGCAGINSVQEVGVDGLFRRTRTRPLVTGSLRTDQAARFSALLVLMGLAILAMSSAGWTPPLLGLAAVVLYNGLYTPLKQVSVLALVPGGLAGAMPPLIGWSAAGGGLVDVHAWMLLGLFFLWQIPHFCLILLRHREEYATAAATVAAPVVFRIDPETDRPGLDRRLRGGGSDPGPRSHPAAPGFTPDPGFDGPPGPPRCWFWPLAPAPAGLPATPPAVQCRLLCRHARGGCAPTPLGRLTGLAPVQPDPTARFTMHMRCTSRLSRIHHIQIDC